MMINVQWFITYDCAPLAVAGMKWILRGAAAGPCVPPVVAVEVVLMAEKVLSADLIKELVRTLAVRVVGFYPAENSSCRGVWHAHDCLYRLR